VQMAILDKIGQEKQRVSERLARLDMERARLSQELGELEIADRLLTKFGRRGMRTEKRRTASLAATAPAGVESGAGSGTSGSNPACSSRQSVSAVIPEAESEKPRTLAAFCGWLGT
jgi:hypothetical protein